MMIQPREIEPLLTTEVGRPCPEYRAGGVEDFEPDPGSIFQIRAFCPIH